MQRERTDQRLRCKGNKGCKTSAESGQIGRYRDDVNCVIWFVRKHSRWNRCQRPCNQLRSFFGVFKKNDRAMFPRFCLLQNWRTRAKKTTTWQSSSSVLAAKDSTCCNIIRRFPRRVSGVRNITWEAPNSDIAWILILIVRNDWRLKLDILSSSLLNGSEFHIYNFLAFLWFNANLFPFFGHLDIVVDRAAKE